MKFNLEEALKSKNKTKYWLSKETGITYANITRYAKNKTASINFDNLSKICKALNCTPNDILVEKEE